MTEAQNIKELPKDWEWVKLDEILDFVIGGDWGKDENFEDDNYSYAYCIRGSEIKNWESEKGTTASLRKIKISNIEKRKLVQGDILVEISGGGPEQPVGRTVLIDKTVLSYKPEVPKICTNFLRLIRPSYVVNSTFLNFYLKLFYNSGEIVKYQAGSNNLRNLKFPDYVKIQIPLPPLPTQQAIVSKIEELFSELDKGIENLRLAQQQLKIYRQAVLKWAFEGKLTGSQHNGLGGLKDYTDSAVSTSYVIHEIHQSVEISDSDDEQLPMVAEPEITYRPAKNQSPHTHQTNHSADKVELPEGWKWVKLGEHLEDISSGKSYRCDERPPKVGEIGIVKVSSVTWGFFDEMESKTCFSKDLLNTRYLIRPGDFLFSRANTIELIGACVLVSKIERELMLSDKILRFTFSSDVSKEFALYYLRSRKGRKEIETLTTGNQDSMRNIGQGNIRQIEFPYCPLKEQQLVVQAIESRFSVADKMEESITQSLQQAEALRQSILKKAFEGKLVSTTTHTGAEEQASLLVPKEFPKRIASISETDLHAGVIALVIQAHEANPLYLQKLTQVKCEKIAHMVEAKIGISLGRNPVKDAAGPDDYPHLKKVEHRANKLNWFGTRKLAVGWTYYSKPGIGKAISKVEQNLPEQELNDIKQLVATFLPFELEHAELVATIYAGWNNLLLQGKKPTDEEIVYESRENWSARKMKIEREKFLKTLDWMKGHEYTPTGRGTIIEAKF